MDELKPAEVQAIVAEITTWNSHQPEQLRDRWQLHALAQLDLQIEAYRVTYQNGHDEVWFRNEDGRLEPAQETVYFVPEYRTKGQML